MRQGLRTLLNLEPGLEVVGEAADGQAGLELVLEKRPDVSLLDVQMPPFNGVEATAAICISGHQRRGARLSAEGRARRYRLT